MRLAVIVRDDFVCQYCGKQGIFFYRCGGVPCVLEKKRHHKHIHHANNKTYCLDKEAIAFHIDHIFPEALGGKTIIDNLILACRACNKSKYIKIVKKPKPKKWPKNDT